ncbi:L-alanine-DL-glutamate epimerase-like enolase superfamily enzyme [Rathayibacter sp. PhB152]|uniref:mandelate racemase/muconate lactonizing enzyme family protein n=1 Tax=Rathayibacter sp. PhB152 TaxID=2485190 RepID=UPI000F4C2D67|nr:mandelate racemase/muconate lactonizing enzyme family protein [Rathayibacter sp. PhB152]ROQ64158.1 L-alanine-DL-glutamate epimerase-like enolase superfamily enzyme [Rathayibacter sp. PhB152]
MSTIAAIRLRPISARMPRPWVPSAPDLHLVRVDVEDSDGRRGTGFSWTPTIGASAVAALLRDDITRFAVGRDTDPAALWPELWAHLHEAGGGGITTIAMAGLDLALWDLRACTSGVGLPDLLVRRQDRLPVYGSGVNLHYGEDELAAQVRRWLARGLDAVKIKVGKPDLGEDVARVGLVRDLIGPDRMLMIDANQRWGLEQAVRAVDALACFDPEWIEEPLRSDDTVGYRRLAERIHVPIALGENLHTIHRFREAIEAGFAGVVQPNVIRVGGITPFLEIAALADAAGVTVAPHLLPDLSAQLAVTRARPTWVEDVEEAGFDALGVLEAWSPVRISGATAEVRSVLGLGLALRAPAEAGRESSIRDQPSHEHPTVEPSILEPQETP